MAAIASISAKIGIPASIAAAITRTNGKNVYQPDLFLSCSLLKHTAKHGINSPKPTIVVMMPSICGFPYLSTPSKISVR